MVQDPVYKQGGTEVLNPTSVRDCKNSLNEQKLVVTQYRTASGSDRMLDSTPE